MRGDTVRRMVRYSVRCTGRCTGRCTVHRVVHCVVHCMVACGLRSTWWAVQQHTLGRCDAEALVRVRVEQRPLHRAPQPALDLIQSADLPPRERLHRAALRPRLLPPHRRPHQPQRSTPVRSTHANLARRRPTTAEGRSIRARLGERARPARWGGGGSGAPHALHRRFAREGEQIRGGVAVARPGHLREVHVGGQGHLRATCLQRLLPLRARRQRQRHLPLQTPGAAQGLCQGWRAQEGRVWWAATRDRGAARVGPDRIAAHRRCHGLGWWQPRR